MTRARIEGWHAWAPGLDDADAWRAWARAPFVPEDDGSAPACTFLPAMARRRQSRLARMTLQAAWPLCAEHEQLPFVFGSRHGETGSGLAMLDAVADGEPLSPTRFGLSVHNAIAGQWSILRGQRGESVAVAGGADTFEYAMLEAAALLQDGGPVLVTMAEERPPEPYRTWIDDVPFSYALALRLDHASADDADAWTLACGRACGDSAPTDWPPALAFLRAHLLDAPALHRSSTARSWHWSRACAA